LDEGQKQSVRGCKAALQAGLADFVRRKTLQIGGSYRRIALGCAGILEIIQVKFFCKISQSVRAKGGLMWLKGALQAGLEGKEKSLQIVVGIQSVRIWRAGGVTSLVWAVSAWEHNLCLR
jgi:hypothetical protein